MRRALAAALALAFAAPSRAAKPGSGGAEFLKIGPGARQAAMSGAASALADDAAALYWNPAGLGTLARQELAFSHTQWLEGAAYEQLLYAHPHAKLGGFGAQFSSLGYGSIDSYSEGGAKTGSVSASDRLFGVGWGSPLLLDRLRVGLGLKYVQETLAGRSASAFAADLGALASVVETPAYGVHAAAGIRHAGSGLKFVSESSPLPRTVFLGAGLKALQERLSVATELSKPRDDGMRAALGVEFWLHPMVAFRTGYQTGVREAGTGISAGVGLRVGRLFADYGMSDFGSLGLVNRASVSWKFGGREEDIYGTGRELMAQGRCAEAILQFNRLLQLDPRHRRALLRIRECRDRLAREKSEEGEDK